MTIVSATLTAMSSTGNRGISETMQYPDSLFGQSDVISTLSTSQTGTITAKERDTFWVISVLSAVAGEGAWVTFGTNPVAASGKAYLLPAGTVSIFGATAGTTWAAASAAPATKTQKET